MPRRHGNRSFKRADRFPVAPKTRLIRHKEKISLRKFAKRYKR